MRIDFEDVKKDREVIAFINASGKCLDVMNYTEHGERHASYVSKTTGMILQKLGYDDRFVNLGLIAGYLHDIGNSVNRHRHGITGAILVHSILSRMGMDPEDLTIIVGAIGNHEEEIGVPVNPVSAALIIADKSDAHRTRVHKSSFDPSDIHDRVNFSIKKNIVTVNPKKKIISSRFYMTSLSSVMEYFKIYLTRIVISEKAAEFLGTNFRLYINDVLINNLKKIDNLHDDKNDN